MGQAEQQIMQRYSTALSRCKQMLTHALQGAWEELLILQGAYVDDIEQLSILESDTQLPPETTAEKRDLLIQIRDTENEVRGLLNARMDELSHSMAQARTHRDVHKAYEVG